VGLKLHTNIVRSQLNQFTEHLPDSSEVFYLHLSCCCQQKIPDLDEAGLKLLHSLKAYM